jgi:hypothetical protein
VRQLVKDPHGEVGRDQRDVDDREASGGEAVGERKHDAPSSPIHARHRRFSRPADLDRRAPIATARVLGESSLEGRRLAGLAGWAFLTGDAHALLAQKVGDPHIVPAHGRNGYVAFAPPQPDPAPPAIAAQDGVVDLGVGDNERPPTEEDRRIRAQVALAHIDTAQRPTPTRPREPAVAVVVDNAAKEGHDAMLRDDLSDSCPTRGESPAGASSDEHHPRYWSAVDVPVQYFQSVIAIELAVTGALLWQIRFFESNGTERPEDEHLPDARLRVGMALVLGATVFGSLWAMVDEGRSRWPAIAVTIGLAISIVPILLRVLPPLAKDAATNDRDPNYTVTLVGLLLYVIVVASFLVLLDID